MREKIILWLLVVSVGLFFVDQYGSESKREPTVLAGQTEVGIEPGQKAPDFQLKTSEGEEVSLSSFKGKHVFINFWATWCPPCKAEMPHIQKFYEEHKDKGVVVLSVNLTHIDKDMGTVRRFVENNGLTFPVVYDEMGKVDAVYKADTIPTSYVVDKEGIIRHRIVGPVSEERLEKIFSALPK